MQVDKRISQATSNALRKGLLSFNASRCVGKYQKNKRFSKGCCFRSFERPHRKPWKDKYRFCAYKSWGSWHKVSKTEKYLIRNAHEYLRLRNSRGSGCSIIHPRQVFHADKHWVDFIARVYKSGNIHEFEVACMLDGEYFIDLVASNWLEPKQKNGLWECGACFDENNESTEKIYVKAKFDSLETNI